MEGLLCRIQHQSAEKCWYTDLAHLGTKDFTREIKGPAHRNQRAELRGLLPQSQDTVVVTYGDLYTLLLNKVGVLVQPCPTQGLLL